MRVFACVEAHGTAAEFQLTADKFINMGLNSRWVFLPLSGCGEVLLSAMLLIIYRVSPAIREYF